MIKKLLFASLFSFCGVLLNAQDFIHTKKNQKIPAKVISVSSNDIVYKRFAQNDGPTFEIPRNEVVKVVFSDGKEEIFSQYETIDQVKSYIVKKIEEFAVDRDNSSYRISAKFEDDFLILGRIRDNGKSAFKPTKWNMGNIYGVHKLSVRDNGIGYVNVVADQVKAEKIEKEKLVLKITDQKEAQLLIDAFNELDSFKKAKPR